MTRPLRALHLVRYGRGLEGGTQAPLGRGGRTPPGYGIQDEQKRASSQGRSGGGAGSYGAARNRIAFRLAGAHPVRGLAVEWGPRPNPPTGADGSCPLSSTSPTLPRSLARTLRGGGLATVLVLLWGLSAAVAVAVGSTPIALADVLRAVAAPLGVASAPSDTTLVIVWELRMPRVLLAAVVGGGLAVVGVAMQALVRNPLAEPYILGVSGGASAAVSLFYLGYLPAALTGRLSVGLAAFLGALGAMVMVFLVAREGPRLPTGRLLLAGVAVQALLGALTSFVVFASPAPQKLQTVLFLLLGTFSRASWAGLALPAAAALAGTAALWLLARPMDALLTGEEPAQSLGVPVEALKRALIGLSALVTGVLVAAAGVIGFVGLIVPHAVRFLVGPAHGRLVPLAFAAGAIFMVWADLAARTLLPAQELPVGVLTALCGVPFFLALLRRAGPLS